MLSNKESYLKCPPAFQMYATDILANKEFRLMTYTERGVFITLLLECWVNGDMPADEKELSKLLNIPSDKIQSELSKHVLFFFKVHDGKISSPELDKYKEELIIRRLKQIEGGKKGQKKKQGNLKGNLIGSEKRRGEESREEESREESIDKGLLDKEHEVWLDSYDNH